MTHLAIAAAVFSPAIATACAWTLRRLFGHKVEPPPKEIAPDELATCLRQFDRLTRDMSSADILQFRDRAADNLNTQIRRRIEQR
jgi:hypothetical protein